MYLYFFVLIQACSSEDTTQEENKVLTNETATNITPTSETPSPTIKPEEAQHDLNIDTSVFSYAESVDVDDTRKVNKHINLIVNMNEGPTAGLATEHVLLQTYDFLQQEDIKGADIVTISINQNDTLISKITVDSRKFKAGEHLINSVLAASKIDHMNDDVVEYGEALERW